MGITHFMLINSFLGLPFVISHFFLSILSLRILVIENEGASQCYQTFGIALTINLCSWNLETLFVFLFSFFFSITFMAGVCLFKKKSFLVVFFNAFSLTANLALFSPFGLAFCWWGESFQANKVCKQFFALLMSGEVRRG